MKKRITLTTAGFFGCYLLFLLLTVPAGMVIGHAQLPAGISLSQVQGTVWRGNARLTHNSGIATRLQWQLRPLALLRGDVAAGVSFAGGIGNAEGTLAFDGERLQVADAQLQLDARGLSLLLDAPLTLEGEIRGLIGRFEGTPDGITALEGDLAWTGAGVAFPITLALGNVATEFTTRDDVITGQVNGGPTPLEIQGQVNLRNASQYDLQLRLRPAADADPAIHDALNLLGRAAPDGTVMLRQRGDLRTLR